MVFGTSVIDAAARGDGAWFIHVARTTWAIVDGAIFFWSWTLRNSS